jgi:PAS domain S-box-containing protein
MPKTPSVAAGHDGESAASVSSAAPWLEVAEVILVGIGADHRVTAINRKGCEVLGLPESEIIGRDWFASFVPERDRERTSAGFDALITGDLAEAESFENTIASASGEERLIAWHNAFLRAPDGAVIGTVSSGEDVTDRHRAEQSQREFEHRVRVVLEGVHDAIVLIDPESLSMVEFNDRACRLLGYTRNEFRHLTLADIEVAETPDVTVDHVDAVKRSGVDVFETVHRAKDGSLRNVEVKVRAVALQGRQLLQSMWRDVTETRQAEDALRDSEERFRAIFEQAAVGVAQIDTITGRFLRVNQKYCQIVGLDSDAMMAQTFMAITQPDDLRDDLANMQRLVRGECRDFSMEKRHIRPDGSFVWVNLTVSPMWQPGEEPRTHIAVIVDITPRKTLEDEFRQAQKLEAVGRLAGGIAHDFNNILQAVVMQVELAKRHVDVDDSGHELLTGIADGAARAADLTRQLLAFSRRQMLRPRDVDLNRLIPDALKMVRRLIGEYIDIAFSPDSDLPQVSVDPVQMEQVMMNLCINARDAMPDGGEISIATMRTTVDPNRARALELRRPGLHVAVVVADSGTGIDRDTRERIFEPFFTTKKLGEGTGLGLSTVYGIVRQHGGAIEVSSETGCGATFTIYLAAVEGAVAATEPDRDEWVAVGGHETVLLAEDEPAVRELVQEMLEDAGYTIVVAKDGQQAVEIFEVDPDAVDLALLDVVMPRLGGKQAYARMAAVRKDLPVVFASGYSGDVVHTRFQIGSGHRLIQKPFTGRELLRVVREVLDGDGSGDSVATDDAVGTGLPPE